MYIKNNKKISACPSKLQRSPVPYGTGRRRGFSLIELLVSIAIFSIAVVMILGATISIVDANKKARTLMVVMNNLNFAVDSMTRSFSTGINPIASGLPSGCGQGFKTTEVDYGKTINSLDIKTRQVSYCIKNKKLYKYIDGNSFELTSPEIEIDTLTFELDVSGQPKLLINMEGTAKIGGKMASTFAIQTTVSQKKLNF